jgi:hypothetical protein
MAASLLVVHNYVPDVQAGVVLMGGTLTSRPTAICGSKYSPSGWERIPRMSIGPGTLLGPEGAGHLDEVDGELSARP